MERIDGRQTDEIRPVIIETGALRNAEGSARISMGETVVICGATVEERVPAFLKGQGRGWVTAEYGMLPRSTSERMAREAVQGKQGGRTMEIQRLIGRSLRGVMDLESLGERTVVLDCDVLEADGGTRTAAVTGACVALHGALTHLVDQEKIPYHPMRDLVAAISVGIVGSEVYLDLCYEEDSRSDVDFNVVATGSGHFVEVQGTAEGRPFSPENLTRMVEAAMDGCRRLNVEQRRVLGLDEGTTGG
jgi:ribonuclease PH